MDYENYIKTPSVVAFIKYFNEKKLEINKEHWIAKERHQFSAESLENACENYLWNSRFTSPSNSYDLFENSTIIMSTDWNSTQDVLNKLSNGLKRSLIEGSDVETLDWCRCILEWGMGSRGKATLERLENLADDQNLNTYLRRISDRLNADTLNLDHITDTLLTMPNSDQSWMSSGLSKIISLSTDKIIIMDSRVGAALCELINKHLIENNKATIPGELLLAWGPASFDHNNFSGPINRRKPISLPDGTNHPLFRNNTDWLRQQIKASWLLRGTVKNSENVSDSIHMLEAGLFMYGYNLDNTDIDSYEEIKTEKKLKPGIDFKEKTISPMPDYESKNITDYSLRPLKIHNMDLSIANYVPTMASIKHAVKRNTNNETLKQGDSHLLNELGLLDNQDSLNKLCNLAGRQEYFKNKFTPKDISTYPKHLIATFLYGEFKRRYPRSDDTSLKSCLIADGYVNTQNPDGKGADNLVSAAKSFGTYFGLIKDNVPTPFFHSYFK